MFLPPKELPSPTRLPVISPLLHVDFRAYSLMHISTIASYSSNQKLRTLCTNVSFSWSKNFSSSLPNSLSSHGKRGLQGSPNDYNKNRISHTINIGTMASLQEERREMSILGLRYHEPFLVALANTRNCLQMMPHSWRVLQVVALQGDARIRCI